MRPLILSYYTVLKNLDSTGVGLLDIKLPQIAVLQARYNCHDILTAHPHRL